MNVSEIWNRLNNLRIFTIVAASPRPGSDFLHSLLDSHKEVLTFDGWLLFHQFYDKSISVYGTNRLMMGVHGEVKTNQFDRINIENFFFEFAWTHLHKFDSRYDNLENKGHLGVGKDEYNLVDIDQFVKIASKIMSVVNFSRRNALLATYAAFEIASGGSLSEKKVMVHSVHLPEYIPNLREDFPDLAVIACIRDPRVYASKIFKYHARLPLCTESVGINNAYLKLALDGINFCDLTKCGVVVLERLHHKPYAVMRDVCIWLEIQYHDSLLSSTWRGREWLGDSLSSNIEQCFDANRYLRDKDLWVKDLTNIDQIVIESLMKHEMNTFGYKRRFKRGFWSLISIFLIIFPTRYEARLLHKALFSKMTKISLYIIRSMLGRYVISYRKLFTTFFNKREVDLVIFGSSDNAQK